MVKLDNVIGLRWNDIAKQEEWLIHWKGYLECEATWEIIEFIKGQFPDAHLEDKVEANQGSIVRPSIIQTFHRRGNLGDSNFEHSRCVRGLC